MADDKENQLAIAFVKVAGTLDAARKERIPTNDPRLLNIMKGIVGNDRDVRNHISILWAEYDKEVNATIIQTF